MDEARSQTTGAEAADLASTAAGDHPDPSGLHCRGTAAADVAAALEVFARGFTFTRSFTHPYLAVRLGPAWVLRDAPRRRGAYRNEEWIAHGLPPQEVDGLAREHTRGKFAVCAICGTGEPEEPLRAGFKALGYRLGTTEALMVHRLGSIPQCVSPAVIERVTTSECAQRLAKAAGSRQILPEHLIEAGPLRQYVAMVDGDLVGWVRSVVVGDATWCSNMYVRLAHRRRGIAGAMLCRMLRDDQAAGAKAAVLLASHSGEKLYPVVGYEHIGTLLLFTPPRGWASDAQWPPVRA